PQKKRFTPAVARPLHFQLLIEIAVVDFAAPADADRVATHETVDRCRIKRADQQLHVFIEFIIVAQITGKPADWKIRKRVELIERDPEMSFEFALVIVLKLVLRRRQERANGIVNQM